MHWPLGALGLGHIIKAPDLRICHGQTFAKVRYRLFPQASTMGVQVGSGLRNGNGYRLLHQTCGFCVMCASGKPRPLEGTERMRRARMPVSGGSRVQRTVPLRRPVDARNPSPAVSTGLSASPNAYGPQHGLSSGLLGAHEANYHIVNALVGRSCPDHGPDRLGPGRIAGRLTEFLAGRG